MCRCCRWRSLLQRATISTVTARESIHGRPHGIRLWWLRSSALQSLHIVAQSFQQSQSKPVESLAAAPSISVALPRLDCLTRPRYVDHAATTVLSYS